MADRMKYVFIYEKLKLTDKWLEMWLCISKKLTVIYIENC